MNELTLLRSGIDGAPSVTEPQVQQDDPSPPLAFPATAGFHLNLIYDAAALAAPASFRAGIQQAADIIAAALTDNITVNVKIDYSGTGGGASAGPDAGLFESYSSIRTALINNATPGDTTFNALPSGSSIQGQSNIAVWDAQLKLFGLLSANDTTTDDGSARFSTDINPNLLVGVALHELTHALGRVPYGPQPDIFDLFRFTSPGTRLFQNGATAPAAYFSLDGGTTKIADYGQTSDASDFLNNGVQGPTDPFNEFYNSNTLQSLTTVDLKQLDALGFHLTPVGPTLHWMASIDIGPHPAGWLPAGVGDFNHDGTADLSWYNASTGNLEFWLLATGHWSASVDVGTQASGWQPAGIGDFNRDGVSDVAWYNPTTTHLELWTIANGQHTATTDVGPHPAGWQPSGIGDFNADGTSDVLWYNPTNRDVDIWKIANGQWSGSADIGTHPAGWQPAGVGDFNHDGTSDVLWYNPTTGDTEVWKTVNGQWAGSVDIGVHPLGWQPSGVADFNNDGTSDILWYNPSNGDVEIWKILNGQWAGSVNVGPHPGGAQLVGVGDVNHDGTTDILWLNPNTAHIEAWLLTIA